MNTLNILDCLDGFTRNMVNVGVYPCNKLPSKVEKPALIVANTDPDNKPGQHWVAFYFPSKGRAEFFDSFGQPPSKRYFTNFLKRNAKTFVVNHQRFQGDFSATCGNFCCLFLYYRFIGKTLKQFSTQFSPYNFNANDTKIISLFKNIKHTRKNQFGGLKLQSNQVKDNRVILQTCKSIKCLV